VGTLPYVNRSPNCQLLRSGTLVQAAHSFSDSACSQQGPLAPSCFQDFIATIGLSDSQLQQTSRLFVPGHPPAPTPDHSGSPRFLDASFRARSPLSPRDALQMHLPVASLQMAGFRVSGRLAASNWCNEAEPGSLALGLTRSRSVVSLHFAVDLNTNHRPASHVRLPLHRGPPLHSEQVITMAGTLGQQDAPGLSWRSGFHGCHGSCRHENQGILILENRRILILTASVFA